MDLRKITHDDFEKFEEDLSDIKILCEDIQDAMERVTSTDDDRTGYLDEAIKKLKKWAEYDDDMKNDLKPIIATLEQFTMEIDDCGDLQDLQMMEVYDYFDYEDED